MIQSLKGDLLKEELIDFILFFNRKVIREELEKMSVPALIMIKVQLEIEIEHQFLN